MVRIIYYDACLIQQHLFEIDKSFDKIELVRLLNRILCILHFPDLSFVCGRTVLSSDSDASDTEVFFLTFDSCDKDLIHHISIILDIALEYSA